MLTETDSLHGRVGKRIKLQILIVIKFKDAAHDYRDVSVVYCWREDIPTPWKINWRAKFVRTRVLDRKTGRSDWHGYNALENHRQRRD